MGDELLGQLLGGVPIRDGVVYVSVWNSHADVARFRDLPDGSIGSEYAVNTDELAEDAMAAVIAQGGASNLSGFYHCPPALMARAIWPGDLVTPR